MTSAYSLRRTFLNSIILSSIAGLLSSAQAQNPNLQFFRQPDTIAGASAIFPFHIGDVTGDSVPDLLRLVVGNHVSIQPGLGNGRFGSASYLNTGNRPIAVSSGLVSGDSYADIVVANSDDQTVGLYFGLMGGGFSSPTLSPIGIYPRNMLMVDFDRNGRMDLVFTGYTGDAREGYLKTFRGQANGTFTQGTTYQSSPATLYTEANSVAAADFNGDGWLDLVVTNPRTRRSLSVFLNNQSGGFTPLAEAMLTGPPGQATTGDFNSDGKADIAFTTITGIDYGTTGAEIVIGVGLGNGDGTFAFSYLSAADSLCTFPQNIAASDIDGDGDLDLAITPRSINTNSNRLVIFRGNGAGGFTVGSQFAVDYLSNWVIPSDLNADGAVDLVVTTNDAVTQTYLGISPNSVALVVTTTVDENNNTISPTSGTGTSLREAINYALTQATPQTITFSSNLAGQTLVLSTVAANVYGPNAFRISDTADITIQGPTTGPGVTLSGGGTLRLFMIDSAVAGVNPKLTLNDLTISGGNSSAGGTIFNTGSLAVNRCTFTGNTTSGQGGAIYTGATWAPAATAVLANSTFSGNTAVVAGAVFVDGAVTLNHVTISGNSSTVEGAITMSSRGVATLMNSIVAGNSRNITGPLQSGSRNNLIDSTDSGGLVHGVNGNLVNVASSGLQALAFNGGPTRTMALSSTSPAVNAAEAATSLATDQRGTSRPQGTAPDIGAFEFTSLQEAALPSISPNGGTFTSAPTITLSTALAGAVIRYTLDGSTPSATEGTVYQGPFALSGSATIRAVAYGTNWSPSQVASSTFTIQSPLQAWRSLHGLAADGSQDLANSSGDGISNLLKYAFNLAPNAGDLTTPRTQILSETGVAGLPRIGRNGTGQLTVTFVRRKATTNPGILYTVETGEQLDALQPLSLSGATVESIDATWERVGVTDPALTSRRFGRLKVTSAP